MSTLLEKLIGSAALKDNFLKCLRIKLKPGSVTTDKIADKAVTPAKLSDSVKTDLIQNPINAVQENLGDHVSDTTMHITAQERSTWNSKPGALTFDNLPTQGSNNPVKSGGVYSKIQDLTTTAQLIRDDVSAIQQEMPGKQNVLTFDNTPTVNSDNPVKSGGVYNAIEAAKNAIQVTTEELRSLKDNGNLIPGMNYKITDYNPAVTGTVRIADRTVNISNQLYLKNNTHVAPFDIVLTALSITDISEKGLAVGKHYTNREARQRYHAYWRNTNFTAWELNVIVDINDDRRPTWCKGEGAPVWISYMKDEWGNEAPFDFKTYGISLPDDVTIDETYNAEELDNNNVWLKGNRWHIFTYYNNDFAYDSSLEGYVKNVKITDWNIIIGGIINSEIEGDANILINSNDINNELYQNVRIVGHSNRMFGSAPDYGDGNIIQGNRNIVVLSTVITEKYNNDCVIKDSESVYLGNYNNNIVIRNCSDINIGNNNSDWDITYAANVYIGNHNIHTDSFDDTNYIRGGYEDGEHVTVRNIVIGNYNSDIYLYAVGTTTIGNYNKRVVIRYFLDGYQCTDVNIGNNNTIGIIDAQDVERGVLSHITIGNNNNVIIRPSDDQYIEAYITIGNYNYSPGTDLHIGLSDVGKFCYYDGTNWQFKTY